MVAEIVREYMHDERTIILAVVSAKYDVENQIVMERARTADPHGSRTLGIITKPDAVDQVMEEGFVSLARNERIHLDLGWHVLRNRTSEEQDYTFAERNRKEQKFFQQGLWASLPSSDTGIESLRSRLSWLLFAHIRKELPWVKQEIADAYEKALSEMKMLGESRSTSEEQRAYLIKISEALSQRCRAAVEGNYEDSFFAIHLNKSNMRRRLRALVQHENTAFANTMRKFGHFREITDKARDSQESDSDVESDSSLVAEKPQRVTREEAIDWVKPFVIMGRGRELEGSYNPLLIRELFLEQSKRWDDIAHQHVTRVWKRCRAFLRNTLADLAPSDVVEALWAYDLEQQINGRLEKANMELAELLADKSSVLTYNQYYLENIQKNRLKVLQRHISSASALTGIPKAGLATINASSFWELVSKISQSRMDEFACDELLDSMLVYYEA